ncbi:hypothetical protein D9M70_628790 [compost metagenome]
MPLLAGSALFRVPPPMVNEDRSGSLLAIWISLPVPLLLELSTRRVVPSLGLLSRLAVTPLSLSLALIASRTSVRVAPSAISTSVPVSLAPTLIVSLPAAPSASALLGTL